MSSNAQQLTLNLPHRPAFGREDFLVSPSNSAAVALIDQWPNWPTYGAMILGPPGSGKTHLVEVWRQRSNAQITAADKLTIEAIPTLVAKGPLAVDIAPNKPFPERAIFHALNFVKQEASNLLFTSELPLADWPVTIPDLTSRLKALPVVMIGQPDDMLLRGVLVKLFHDRQIATDEATLNYMMLRMPRSLESARNIVAEIDQRALAEKAEITRSFVARILNSFSSPDLFDSEN